MRFYKGLIGLIILLFSAEYLSAQILTGISSVWDDTFIEWEVFTTVEEDVGELNLQRLNNWYFSLNESSAQIKLRWKDKPEEWQVMGDGQSITMRTVFRNDFSEWRIRYGSQSYTFKSKWRNQFEEWQLRDTDYGIFEVYTVTEGDPRDWFIIDELTEEVPLLVKMSMVFIAVYHSFPRD